VLAEFLDNLESLLRSFPFAVNYFRKAQAQGSVVVDFGEPQVLIGKVLELVQCLINTGFSCAHAFKQFPDFFFW